MSVVIVLATFGVLLGTYYLWSRRRFYWFSWKTKGPWGLPFLGIALRIKSLDKLLPEFMEIGKKYKINTGFAFVGPIPFVATKDPVVIEKILTSPDCLGKPQMYDPFAEALGGGLVSIGPPKCTMHRKLINPSFNHQVLLTFFPVFNEGTDYLNQKLGKLVGQAASELSELIYGCSLRISIETTMGMNGSEDREKSVKLLPHTNEVLRTTMIRLVRPWFRIDAIFRLSKLYKPYMESKKAVDDFVNEVIAKKFEAREKQEEVVTDSNTPADPDKNINIKKTRLIFIDQVMDMYKKNLFNKTDIFAETCSMIYAAFETSATTLNIALVMLAQHPHYQERLFEEIVAIFPDKDFDVQYDELGKLTYLDMFINETLRVASTIPVILRHAGADVYISDEMTIPKGTELVIDIFDLHRSEDIWGPNATSFDPEHFLPEKVAGIHPYAFIPFLKGSRNCLGWRYATMLLKVVLIKVVRNYRFTTSFRFEDLKFFVNLALKFQETPKLEVHRR